MGHDSQELVLGSVRHLKLKRFLFDSRIQVGIADGDAKMIGN
jgi:hypothetical protein